MAPGLVLIYRSVFIVTGRFFMVPGGFSCFLIAPGLVFMIPGGFLSSHVGLNSSRAPQVRSETLRTPKRHSLHLYLGPTIQHGSAGHRPALA